MSEEERCPECGGYRGLPRILHDQDEPHECSNEFHKSMAPVIEFPEPHPPQAVAPMEPAPQPNRRPVCPHCGSEGMIAGNKANIAGVDIMVVRCGNNDCRKILAAFQPLQLQMMQPPVTH